MPKKRQSKEEERLRQSEERFAAFMDNLPGYAWMKDLQGRYVYINQMVKGLPGYQSLGKTDAQIWPADLAAEYRAHDQQVIAAKKPLHTIERFVHEGKQRCMLGSKFPIFDETGAVALVAGTGVDITERIEAEGALRASTARLQALTRRLVELQEAERRDISRELHDRVGQTLTAMRINMEIIRDRLGRHDDAEIRARNDDSHGAARIRNDRHARARRIGGRHARGGGARAARHSNHCFSARICRNGRSAARPGVSGPAVGSSTPRRQR